MRSIFLRFYIGMLIATITVALLSYGLLASVNQFRFEHYIASTTGSTFVLLGEALSRTEGAGREESLALVNKLSGLHVEQLAVADVALSGNELSRLAQHRFLVRKSMFEAEAEIFFGLQAEQKQVLTTRLSDVSEQVVRGMALLILGEISELDQAAVASRLQELSAFLRFPVYVAGMDDFQFSYSQQRLLQRNELLVEFVQMAGDDALQVYAPLMRDSDQLLVVGPLPKFSAMPKQLVLITVIISLLMMALSAYILVTPLERRLRRMAREVEGIGVEAGTASITVHGSDMLSRFAEKVNAMALRIQKLLQTQRELTRAVSHELRTPISRMKFHLALLEGNGDDVEQNRKHLAGMQSDLDELEQLVDELLTYATLEQARPDLTLHRLNMKVLIENLFDEIRLVKPDISLKLDFEGDCFNVLADHHFLQRACQNLLINAQRHAYTQVTVRFAEVNGNYQVTVDDDGDGIPEAQRAAIFDPFSRLDKSRNRRSGGYGLGLAIVYQVMRWHQGSVTADESPSGGARFILSWPAFS